MAATDPPPRNGRHSSEEWLLGLVRQMVIAILDEREKLYKERFDAQTAALSKADAATDKRFEGVNEFRKAMTDRDVLYMPRAESSSQYSALVLKVEGHEREDVISHDSINKRIDEIGKRFDNFEGTMKGSRATLMTIAGVATFLVSVIVLGTFFFNNKVQSTSSAVQFQVPPGYVLVPSTPPQPAPR